jgi:hypothetical protein
MSSIASDDQRSLGKGKGRAESPNASESTPLLASQSRASQEHPETTTTARRRLWSKLTFVFLVSLSACVVVFALLALLGYSYAARALTISPQDVLDYGLVLKGPDRVDVLNVTGEGGIWLEIEGKVGLDAGALLDVNSDRRDPIWRAVWKSVGRWGIRRVDKTSINLSTIQVSFKNDTRTVLAEVEVEPLQISLSTNPPSNESWLTRMSTPVFITPTQNSAVIMQFLRNCWREGLIDVRVSLRKAFIHGGGLDDHGWRSSINVERSNVTTGIHMKSELHMVQSCPAN